MRCAHHPEVEAHAQCERCGDSLCNECEHQRAGESFCTACGHALLDQRRAHLPRERALFRLGVGLVTFGLLPLATALLGMALAAASKLSGPPQGWLFFYFVLGSALVATGAALLLRKPWARWSALVASLTWVVALPLGPLMTLWAVVLLARKGTAVVFDREHARLVARTKELRAGSLPGGLGAVVVLLAASLSFVAFYNLVAEGRAPSPAVSSP